LDRFDDGEAAPQDRLGGVRVPRVGQDPGEVPQNVIDLEGVRAVERLGDQD
jgi:hypothetical protein